MDNIKSTEGGIVGARRSMKMQKDILDKLFAVMKDAQEHEELKEGVTPEEFGTLWNYLTDMQTAADTALRLIENVGKVVKENAPEDTAADKEDAKAEGEEKAPKKPRRKKKKDATATPSPEAAPQAAEEEISAEKSPEAAPQAAEETSVAVHDTDELDLSFLD